MQLPEADVTAGGSVRTPRSGRRAFESGSAKKSFAIQFSAVPTGGRHRQPSRRAPRYWTLAGSAFYGPSRLTWPSWGAPNTGHYRNFSKPDRADSDPLPKVDIAWPNARSIRTYTIDAASALVRPRSETPLATLAPSRRHRAARNSLIMTAFAISMKNAPTSGTMRNATCEGPCRWVTAVMLAIAVGVAPRPKPMKPADTTAAS